MCEPLPAFFVVHFFGKARSPVDFLQFLIRHIIFQNRQLDAENRSVAQYAFDGDIAFIAFQ